MVQCVFVNWRPEVYGPRNIGDEKGVREMCKFCIVNSVALEFVDYSGWQLMMIMVIN